MYNPIRTAIVGVAVALALTGTACQSKPPAAKCPSQSNTFHASSASPRRIKTGDDGPNIHITACLHGLSLWGLSYGNDGVRKLVRSGEITEQQGSSSFLWKASPIGDPKGGRNQIITVVIFMASKGCSDQLKNVTPDEHGQLIVSTFLLGHYCRGTGDTEFLKYQVSQPPFNWT